MGLMGRVWAEIGGDASGLKNAANEAKNALDGIGKSATGVEGIATKAMAGIAVAAAALMTAVKVGKEVWDFSSEGAQIASLQGASHKLAVSYGTNMAQIVTAVKDASFNTITEYEAMKAANLAMTMGVSTSATEIGNLMEIAIMRGRAFGLTTEEAFEKITRGIGRLSPKILDDIGFNMKGVTTQAGMLAAVLAQGNKELESMGGLMMDASTPYQRISTMYTDWMNNAKMMAGYTLLPFIASPEEVRNINQEAAAVGILSGTYEDYYKGMSRAAMAGRVGVGQRGVSLRDAEIMTKGQFTDAQRIAAQAASYFASQVDDAADETQNLNLEMALQAGLAGELTKVQEGYLETLDKYGEKSWRTAQALEEASKKSKEWMYEQLTSKLNAEEHGEVMLEQARNMGLLSESEYKAATAAAVLQDAFLEGRISGEQYLGISKDLNSEIGQLMRGGKSTYYIDIIIRYNGVARPMTGWGSIADDPSWYRRMHGGSVAVMKHGGAVGGEHGMMVPPGFSNDGMPVWVSSGERLDVTPAGNKNSPNDDLLAEMKAVRRKLDDLPTAIRDAVLLAA